MAVRAPGEPRGVAEGSGPGTHGPPAGILQEHFLGVGPDRIRLRGTNSETGVRRGSDSRPRGERSGCRAAALGWAGARSSPLGATALSFLVKWETVTTRAGRSVAAAHTDEPSKHSFSPFLSEFPERSEEKEP